VHRAAGKHGIDAQDAIRVTLDHVVAYAIDDGPPERELRLGFDAAGRLLEVVVVLLDDGSELVIHAMKARASYLDLLP
jgi:hypothetical protein